MAKVRFYIVDANGQIVFWALSYAEALKWRRLGERIVQA